MAYYPHLRLIKTPVDLVLRLDEQMQYRRYLANAPAAVVKPQRPSYYDGPYLASLKYVWEIELFIRQTDVRAMALNQLYLISIAAQEASASPTIELRDYCDPITEITGHTTAPPLTGQPTWPNVGNYVTKFAVFNVLIDQPVRTRKGIPTAIEVKLTEV